MTAPRDPWDAGPPGDGGPHSASVPPYPGGTSPDANWGSQQIGELAGWWLRVGATVVDALVVGIVGLVLELLLGRSVGEIVNVGVQGAYLTLMIGGSGQTIGNRVVGTRVVATDGRSQVGYAKAALRWVIPPVLLLMLVVPLLLDILWPAWDQQRQTLHDKAAGTLVIRVR